MSMFLLDCVPTHTPVVDNQGVWDRLAAHVPAWHDMSPQVQSLHYLVAKLHQADTGRTFAEMRVACTAYMALYALPDMHDIVAMVLLQRKCLADMFVYEGSLAHTLHRAVHRAFAWNAVDAGSYAIGNADKFAATWGQIVAACSFLVAMFYETDAIWYINTMWKICVDVLCDDMPTSMRECAEVFRFSAYTQLPEYVQRQHQAYRDAVVECIGDTVAK